MTTLYQLLVVADYSVMTVLYYPSLCMTTLYHLLVLAYYSVYDSPLLLHESVYDYPLPIISIG